MTAVEEDNVLMEHAYVIQEQLAFVANSRFNAQISVPIKGNANGDIATAILDLKEMIARKWKNAQIIVRTKESV